MAATHRRSVTGDRVLGFVLLLLELVAAAAAPTGKEGPQGNFPLQSDRPENYGQNNKRHGTAQMPVYRPQPSTYGMPVYRPQPSTYGRPVYRPQPSRQQQEEAASTVELRFICDTLKTPIYTHKTISAFDGQPVEVAIYRNGQVITFGPLSSLNVEIVALPGDFSPEDNLTTEDFDRRIVISRDRQGSVLEGRCLRTMLNGRQSFDGIRFKEGSSRTSTRRFTLAARVVRGQNIGGLRVHEAFMGPVNVKDRRSEANEKSDRPQLNDEVYRLKGIAKNGPYSQRLQKGSIMTVQDFLKAYNTYPERLRDILEINSHRSKPWETMTTHALDCFLGDTHKLKKYVIAGGNVVLFFNCVHDLVGAEFHGHYFAKEKFDEWQKAFVERLKEQAYKELEGIELDYVMKDGRPINIYTSTNAVGLPPCPTQDAMPQPNPPDQHATYQGVDNSGPAENNQHLSQTLPEHADCNIATLVSGAGGSEQFLPDHHQSGTAAFENDPAGTIDEMLRELDDGWTSSLRELDDGWTSSLREIDDGWTSSLREIEDGWTSSLREIDDGWTSSLREIDDGWTSSLRELDDGWTSSTLHRPTDFEERYWTS